MFVNNSLANNYNNSLMHRVYAWMSFGLALSGFIAYYVSHNAMMFFYVQQPSIVFGLVISQLLLVMGLSFFINRLSYATAAILFALYSLSVGITFSSLFYIYTESSIFLTFLTINLCMNLFYFTSKEKRLKKQG